MYDLLTLSMEGIKNLKIPTVFNESKSVMRPFPYKERPRMKGLNNEF